MNFSQNSKMDLKDMKRFNFNSKSNEAIIPYFERSVDSRITITSETIEYRYRQNRQKIGKEIKD